MALLCTCLRKDNVVDFEWHLETLPEIRVCLPRIIVHYSIKTKKNLGNCYIVSQLITSTKENQSIVYVTQPLIGC